MVFCNIELCPPLGTVQNFYLGECTLMVGVRNRLKNKDIGKPTYYHNDISVSADKSAWIMKIPQSTSWYFRMWIQDEQKQFRRSLRTKDQDEAMRLGIEEHANIIKK